jgi:hypothetical protein
MATRKTPTADAPDSTDTGGEWQMPTGDRPLTIAQATEQTEELAISERIRLLLSNTATETVKLKLSRVDPKTGTLGYCCNYTIEEWEADEPMDMIRANWGPGKYELHIIGAGGSLGRPRFTIAQPFAMINPTQQPQAQQQPANNDGVIAQALQSIAQMIMQGQQQTAQLIQSMAPPPRDEIKELEKLKLMKDIFSAGNPPPQNNSLSAITEIMTAMKAMKDFSGELNPPSPVDADNPMSMIPALLDTVKSFAANRTQPQPPQYQEAISPVIVPQTLEQPLQQSQQPNPAEMILKGATQKIIELATNNADPKEGGQFIHDSLPDELLPYLAYPIGLIF